MRVSIITPVYNAASTLRECLESVNQQTAKNIEHIVIDGGSTDESVAFIKKYGERVTYTHSKPDKGIADAFNQGIEKARGDYLYFLGASDTLYSPDIIEKVFNEIDGDPLLICGRVQRTDEQTNAPIWVAPKSVPVRRIKWVMLHHLALPHQGLFMHRAYFEQYGDFNTHVKYAMDYELLLRSYHTFPSVVWCPHIVANWRAGGIGADRLSAVFDEYHQIKCQHHIAPYGLLWLIDKMIRVRLWLRPYK